MTFVVRNWIGGTKMKVEEIRIKPCQNVEMRGYMVPMGIIIRGTKRTGLGLNASAGLRGKRYRIVRQEKKPSSSGTKR